MAEQRLHPVWIVLRALATLRAMALPLIVVVVSGGDARDLIGFGFVGLFIALTIAARALGWWRFTYAITAQGLRVRSGLLSRQDRLMPYERIQSVDLREGLLERLLRVSQVRIESAAGGSDADAILGAVSRAEAARIRTTLLGKRGAPGDRLALVGDVPTGGVPTTEISVEGELIHRLSLGELLVAGATSSRVGPALAIMAGAFQFADELIPVDWWKRLAMSAPNPTLRTIVALAFVAVVFAWILATVSTVLTFGNFELRREGDRLLISHGLFERRRSSIPIARIQAVTVSEGWFRQPFGLAAVRVESAGYGKTSGESGILAPIIRRTEIPRLLARACPAYAVDLGSQTLQALPRRARRRYVLAGLWSILALSALLTLLAVALPWSPWWWGALVLILAPAAMAYGLLEYRDAGWAFDDASQLVLRTRGVDRVTAVTLRRRLQERSVTQHPFQRRAGLASFRIAVASGGAGGRFTLVHLDAAVAANLMERLGPRRAAGSTGTPLVAALTTVTGDHDDSYVELRSSFLTERHDGGEDSAQRAPDRDRPMMFEPPRRAAK